MRVPKNALFLPDLFNRTITLYNRHQNPQEKRTEWHRTVLRGCAVTSRHAQSMNVGGQEVIFGDHFIVRIPKDERYRPSREWNRRLMPLVALDGVVVDDESETIYVSGGLVLAPLEARDGIVRDRRGDIIYVLAQSFTLNPGDLVFIGDVDVEINEKVEGKRSRDYLEMYAPDCFFVQSYADNTGPPRGLEHYKLVCGTRSGGGASWG